MELVKLKHEHPNGEPPFRSVAGCPRCEQIKEQRMTIPALTRDEQLSGEVGYDVHTEPTPPTERDAEPSPDSEELPELPDGAEDYARKRDGTLIAMYPDGSTAAWDGFQWLNSVATIPLTGSGDAAPPAQTDAQMRAGIMGKVESGTAAPLGSEPTDWPVADAPVRVTEFAYQGGHVKKHVIPNADRPDRPVTFYVYGGKRYAGSIGQYVQRRVGRSMEYTLYPTQEEVDMARNVLVRQREMEARAHNRNRNPNATLPETMMR